MKKGAFGLASAMLRVWSSKCSLPPPDPKDNECPYYTDFSKKLCSADSAFEWNHLVARSFDTLTLEAAQTSGEAQSLTMRLDGKENLVLGTAENNALMQLEEQWLLNLFRTRLQVGMVPVKLVLTTEPVCGTVHDRWPLW